MISDEKFDLSARRFGCAVPSSPLEHGLGIVFGGVLCRYYAGTGRGFIHSHRSVSHGH